MQKVDPMVKQIGGLIDARFKTFEVVIMGTMKAEIKASEESVTKNLRSEIKASEERVTKKIDKVAEDLKEVKHTLEKKDLDHQLRIQRLEKHSRLPTHAA